MGRRERSEKNQAFTPADTHRERFQEVARDRCPADRGNSVRYLLTLIWQSIPSIKAVGIGYLWGKTWDPVRDVYGAYPFLIGTLLTSFLSLIISIPFSFAVGIFLGEYYP